jgi:hypothetical protein
MQPYGDQLPGPDHRLGRGARAGRVGEGRTGLYQAGDAHDARIRPDCAGTRVEHASEPAPQVGGRHLAGR